MSATFLLCVDAVKHIMKTIPFRVLMSKFASIRSSYRFIKMAAAAAQYYIRFRICWYRCLQKVKIYQQTKFRLHMSIRGWDITTSVLKNKRPPYSNSISGFIYDHFTVIGVLFCTSLPNFVQIGPPTAEIWRHISFSRWPPRQPNTTSGFVFLDVAFFRWSKSISKPNFDDISQFVAEI